MHRNFADWYRAVSLTPPSETLESRWKSIVAFTSGCGAEEIGDLTRMFYGREPKGAEFLEEFRTVFKDEDKTFAMRDNDPELQVLAGSALVNLLVDGQGLDRAAALAILVTDCRGLRKAPLADIPLLARNHLNQVSASLRASKVPAPPMIADFSQKLTQVKAHLQANQVPQLVDPLGTFMQGIVDAMQGLANFASASANEQQLRAEESEILWWIVGGCSRDSNTPFQDLPSPSGILIAAKELSELVKNLPGPLAAPAFLSTVIKTAHPELGTKVSISEAIGACTIAWQKSCLQPIPLAKIEDICPLHCAIAKSVEADGNKGWYTVFASLTGLKASEKFKPLDLALQAYDERMFIRALDIK